MVEMVFDGVFIAAGDENKLFDASRPRFLEGIMDQRFIHHRQHFLGHGFGGRQKARAQPTHGKYGFTDFLLFHRQETKRQNTVKSKDLVVINKGIYDGQVFDALAVLQVFAIERIAFERQRPGDDKRVVKPVFPAIVH